MKRKKKHRKKHYSISERLDSFDYELLRKSLELDKERQKRVKNYVC